MHRTLFYIPPEVLGFPVFGFPSWTLIAWLVVCAVTAAGMLRRGHTSALVAGLPSMLVVAAVLGFVLPHIQVVEDGVNLGVAIRGYGVMMVLAIAVGLGSALYRAGQMRIHPELIYSMAIWMIVSGVIGARFFFVAQKWDQFASDSFRDMIWDVLNMAEGGLVVYGALIGALIGLAMFLARNRLPLLPICDLIAASMLFGLAIGRIGCLMNGCCYGGSCDHWWAVTFPMDSPPYMEQLQAGQMHGFGWGVNQQGQVVVEQVQAGSAAESAGLREGDVVLSVGGRSLLPSSRDELSPHALRERVADRMRVYLLDAGQVLRLQLERGGTVTWEVPSLRERSFPVHPTQVYSAINAALLGLLLWTLYPLRRRDGQVFAVLLTLYPITRFLLEIIRVDEGSFAGTGLSISQNVSLVVGALGVALWIYLTTQPAGPLWRASGTAAAAH